MTLRVSGEYSKCEASDLLLSHDKYAFPRYFTQLNMIGRYILTLGNFAAVSLGGIEANDSPTADNSGIFFAMTLQISMGTAGLVAMEKNWALWWPTRRVNFFFTMGMIRKTCDFEESSNASMIGQPETVGMDSQLQGSIISASFTRMFV